MRLSIVLAVVLALGVVSAEKVKRKEPAATAETTEAPSNATEATASKEVVGKDAASEDEPHARIYRRIIPADVLRDFPRQCFASTLCRLFDIDQDWSLEPFCGQSHCHFDERTGRLFEVVLDCGPKPLNPAVCKVLKPGNETATFPACCDIYDTATCKFPEFQVEEDSGESSPSGGAEEEATTTEAPKVRGRVRGRRPPAKDAAEEKPAPAEAEAAPKN